MGNTVEVINLENQALQLHDKVQKLIEQYSEDKKKMAELESQLAGKIKELKELTDLYNKLEQEVSESKTDKTKQQNELNDLKKRNIELERTISTFEGFANDLNSKIDDLIPKIEKL